MKVTAYWISGFCIMGGVGLRLNAMHHGGKLILVGLLILLVTMRLQERERSRR